MSRLLIHGKLYEPIKVGDEGDWYFGEPGATCGDCGEAYGKQHLPQCDVERCPLCGGQLLSCDCGPVYDVEDERRRYRATQIKPTTRAYETRQRHILRPQRSGREHLRNLGQGKSAYEKPSPLGRRRRNARQRDAFWQL